MIRGWLFDVYADYDNNRIVSWIKTKNGIERLTDEFHPRFYVHSALEELKALRRKLESIPFIDNIEFYEKKLSLGKANLSKVLCIDVLEYRELKNIARMIDACGDYKTFQLYDVDIRLSQRYLLNKRIFPFAFLEFSNKFELLDNQWSFHYPIPNLKSIFLDVKIAAKKKIPTIDDKLVQIFIDDMAIDDNDETDLLLELVKEIKRIDPDIIYTNNGDSFLFPYLYHRANVSKMMHDFQLGREWKYLKADRDGKTYFSYGQIKYKPPFYSLKGRMHIDKSSSFTLKEGGMYGLIDLSRLCGIPLQTLSRLSPGTAISAMQVNQAMREGYLILWKKNIPEKFKSARELLVADRGGFIYEPRVGIHDQIVEIDFAALYPSIMVKFNISPETILCDCCRNSAARRVPEINYHICEKRRGLIPKVLRPLIYRRMKCKQLKEDERNGKRFKERANLLKWVLVTCFGYTGYKNARFGRIECHEAINAYGREILLQASEIADMYGYEILHGIVDSLWLKANDFHDHEKLCEHISGHVGIPFIIEGIYKWIVFLPNKGNGIGALNRYYGLFENGELKLRGLEYRKHDTPTLIKNAQFDMLKVLSKAEDSNEFLEKIPKAIDVLSEHVNKMLNGDCDLKDLVITKVISKRLEHYRQFNDQVAALMQLRREGFMINPGQGIRYIICNSDSKDYTKRVKVAEFIEGSEKFDKMKYREYLLKAGESLLRPLGYDAEKLSEII